MKPTDIQEATSRSVEVGAAPGQCVETLAQAVATLVHHLVPNPAVGQGWEPAQSWRKRFTFYRIRVWRVCDVSDLADFFGTKMQSLFTLLHVLSREVCYGLESDGTGPVSLLLGIGKAQDGTQEEATGLRTLVEGALPGAVPEPCEPKLLGGGREAGWIGGTPVAKANGGFLHRDLSALMRCLNGQRYTILVVCRPLSEERLQTLFQKTMKIRDTAFACSKWTLSWQQGDAKTEGSSSTHTESTSGTIGLSQGLTRGLSIMGGLMLEPMSVGVGVLKATSLARSVSATKGESTSETTSLAQTISKSVGGSAEVQNGLAMELMELADATLARLKAGRGIGMWQTSVTFSAATPIARDLIRGTLHGLFASDSPTALPPFGGFLEPPGEKTSAVIPKGFFDGKDEGCASLVTSEELCALCPIPAENTVGFEIRRERLYALSHAASPEEHRLGQVCEYDRPFAHADFGLSDDDLNKHTLVCGITGCGKTNTVKRLLAAAGKPFLVIEPAKKEYRDLKGIEVYTFGRPELRSPRLNPFYILPGISPQQHIDALKELFSAAFAFYGPMPYIFEKCLNAIYVKKGWNLELGLHNAYVAKDGITYDDATQREFAKQAIYRFLCPTMEDLKAEIARFIREELTYEGEVKGNIEGALKARIESLCVGAKGYLFNTVETLDFQELLKSPTVFELEGLTDDADKAFALGLSVIFINACRQVEKEREPDGSGGLRHLLVIEEAHRLLTAVPTGHDEYVGNPKGKAVEYFTNLIAEMRSYGQGVVIAEQIPCKLAPEVLKNTSNKIVHRLVAKDDQEALANAIGVHPGDAIHLGTLRVGYALCHKEGMAQPVAVQIERAEPAERRKDGDLIGDTRAVQTIRQSIAQSRLQAHCGESLTDLAARTLVSLLALGGPDPKDRRGLRAGFVRACADFAKTPEAAAALCGISDEERKLCIRETLFDAVAAMLLRPLFCTAAGELPSKDLLDTLRQCLTQGFQEDSLNKLREQLAHFYGTENLTAVAATIVKALLEGAQAPRGRLGPLVDACLLAPERSGPLCVLLKLKR